MHEVIGEVAGRVWQTIEKKGEMPLTQIAKTVKEKDTMVYQALGWLAREDKINYHSKEKKTFVSLSYDEREIFKTFPKTGSQENSLKQ